MLHLDLATQEGDYAPERDNPEPEPHIVDLAAEIADCDEAVSTTLSVREHEYVTFKMHNTVDLSTMLVGSCSRG